MLHIAYLETDGRDLDSIAFLWEKLREHHRTHFPYGAERYPRMTWADRKQGLLEKTADGHLRLDIARDSKTGKLVGYCISSVTAAKIGEIESIYIEKDCRHDGIGDNFMKKAMEWMDALGTSKRIIGVGAGNEDVFSFYARYGFYPRVTILHQLEKE
jgi:ribosomal protein S18 acetylase RimI-like enzyme